MLSLSQMQHQIYELQYTRYQNTKYWGDQILDTKSSIFNKQTESRYYCRSQGMVEMVKEAFVSYLVHSLPWWLSVSALIWSMNFSASLLCIRQMYQATTENIWHVKKNWTKSVQRTVNMSEALPLWLCLIYWYTTECIGHTQK